MVCCSSTVLSLLVSVGMVIAVEPPPATPALAVAVVKGWADLLAQPVIDLGAGVCVRLGLESATGAAGSGVLLYCLAEGFTPPRSGSGEDWLGPVRISLVVDGVRCVRAKSMWSRQVGDRHPVLGLPLYARMISIPMPGSYVIGIEAAPAIDITNERTLATATIVGVVEADLPWSNLGAPARGTGLLEETADQALAKAVVIPCGLTGTFRAIPIWDGMEALSHLPDADQARFRQPLPTLLPTTPDPHLKLSRHDGFLVLDSQVALAFCAGDPSFLARYWINDQPFIPAAGAGARYGGICFNDVHRVALQCDLDPAALKAKSGDRIGVQILYCPGGWTWSGQDGAEHLAGPLTLETDPDLPPALLSNRLDFVFP